MTVLSDDEREHTVQAYTVLIVDDNPNNLETLTEYLAEYAIEVLIARDGTQGIARAKLTHPSLILLDIMMPGMDGFETCRRLKADTDTQDIPIIFMTALTETEHKVKGFQLGAVDYVIKPFEREEVMARVLTHLRLRTLTEHLERQVQERTADLRQANQQLEQEIAERKQAETEREKLQEQLLQAQKMESVGRLAGGVAHDFNNMLGVILGHAEIALEQIDPSQPLFSDLQEIRKAAEHSADLTRQLLAFARKQTIAPQVLDLNKAVEGTLRMLRRLIGEDIDLAWRPGTGLWPISMDPAQVDQILTNLCVNARDAIGSVGRVTIETENAAFDEADCAGHAGFVPGEYVMLVVSDTGHGMDKNVLEHLFEPFFTTKKVGQGTGLGLATVYGIVKQNNGFIYVYSEPGRGTAIKIYLPRHEGGAVQVHQKGPEEPIGRGRETVLLVEDEPSILNMDKRVLERLGYRVLAAGTPGEAMRLAGQHVGQIDLLITDVVMPEMNGRDLSEQLLSLCPDIKCLFMSGYTADVIAHHGVLDEGVNFIQKPFSIKDLAAKVRAVLNRP